VIITGIGSKVMVIPGIRPKVMIIPCSDVLHWPYTVSATYVFGSMSTENNLYIYFGIPDWVVEHNK
jgi:hypothetical protein